MSRKPAQARNNRHSVAVTPSVPSTHTGNSFDKRNFGSNTSPILNPSNTSASSGVNMAASASATTSSPSSPVKFDSRRSYGGPGVRSVESVKNVPHHNEQIEQLQLKKRTLLGTIAQNKRAIEEVRNEMAKLKVKESDLISTLEKRESSVQQLTTQIEELEIQNENAKNANEENKRKYEEERNRRAMEEVERRRKEEETEERRRQMVNNLNLVSPRGNPTQSFIKNNPLEDEDEALRNEEERLMRAMNRGKGAAPTSNVPTRTSYVKPAQSTGRTQEAPKEVEKPKVEKEETRNNSQELLQYYQNRSGVSHTFHSPPIYDYDSQVFFTADFTDWKEIPVFSEIDHNFSVSLTLPIPPGVHFYRFKIGRKWEINKSVATGVAPSGDLMNKIDIS